MQGAVGVSVTAAGQSVTSSLPEEAGTGATPQSAAKNGSLRARALGGSDLRQIHYLWCSRLGHRYPDSPGSHHRGVIPDWD